MFLANNCLNLHLDFHRWRFFYTFAAMEKKYTADELSYIAFVAREHCNLCEKGWEKYVVENALDLFNCRIEKIDCAANYELYKSTDTLQEKLVKFGFDSEKYWFLLLFLKDYTESCYGEYYIFDSESMGDNIKKMLRMLNQQNFITCELTLSNKTESAHISAAFIKDELIELLQSIPQKTPVNYYPCIGKEENNVLWHKRKFFMKMLDYFLQNYSSTAKKRKDWLLISQSLYLVGYLNDVKYLNGFERTEHKITEIYGKNTIKADITPLKGLGKFFTDNTKNINEPANRSKSLYCYNPYLDLVN